jgi:hypothetical protein
MSEKEIKESGGLIYDVDDEAPTTLPNASDILDNVIKVLECLATDEMQMLKKTDKMVFEQTMENKFPEFSFSYYSMFKKILSGDDLEPLFKMLSIVSTVNDGKKTVEEGEKAVGRYLTKFLPPELVDKVAAGMVSEDDIKSRSKF